MAHNGMDFRKVQVLVVLFVQDEKWIDVIFKSVPANTLTVEGNL